MIILIILCGLLQACEDSLEVNPPINQINTSQVFESVNTADAALSSLYADLQAYSFFSGSIWGSGAILGTYTDELYCYSTSTQNADLDIYNNVQVASNTKIKSTWSTAYQEIYMTNAILEGIALSNSIPEKDKKRIRGEALFVRALIHFQLSQVFGDIPYVTTTDYIVNQAITKTSEAECLLQIRSDLYEATNLLEDTYRNTERLYPNRKAVELVLATVLMTQHQWSEAETLLKEIIKSPLYSWQPDLLKTFKMTGKHILWQLKPLKNNNGTNEALLYYFATALPNTYTLSDHLLSSFSSNDLRKQSWIKEIIINQKKYYRADKYRNITNNTDEYSIVFRLEEAYLLLAESLAQQDKLSEAVPYLNAVKEKAGIALEPLNPTKEKLLNEILDESRKEFFTERGIRFTTLKRAGRLNDLTAIKTNWTINHQYWPIPLSDLLLNPNLNPQNNGY